MSIHEQTMAAATAAGNALAGGVVIASVIGYLPAISAFMGILWFGVQIYIALDKHWRRKTQKRTRASDATCD